MAAASAHHEMRTSDGAVVSLPTPESIEERDASYTQWVSNVTRPRPHGHATVQTRCEPLHWTPVVEALADSTVALVSTGGVHLRDQEPFDVYGEEGDGTCRPLSGDLDTGDLTVTHTHYATQDARADINVMFPLDRLRELADEGAIGGVSTMHYGFMGFLPDPRPMLEGVLPGVCEDLRDRGVDAVVLTGG